MTDISVTVPIYNVEKYLVRCLNSIVGQSFKGDFEIICVDDGSTDKSGEILDEFAKRYPDKIKAIHQNNQGLSSARNTALKHVTGKYTMFVDSDDFIEQRALEELFNYAESHKAEVVVFDYLYGSEGSKDVRRQNYKNISDKYGDNPFNVDTAETFVYHTIPVSTWQKFYLTDLVKDIKFEYDLNNQDVPHWAIVFTKAKNIYYYPKPFYFYTACREDAITVTKGVKTFDVFRAFSLAEKILREAGYFEKIKAVHYAYFFCNILNRMVRIKPELRREFYESIKKFKFDIDYSEFDKEDLNEMERNAVLIIRYMKEHDYEATDRMMEYNRLWRPT